MKVCPGCGFIDRSQFRASRVDYDREYMRFDEAESEVPRVFRLLKDKPTFFPYYIGPSLQLVDCRVGTGGLWLYRVLKENFRVSRERKQHKTAVAVVNQRALAIENHAPEIWGLR